MIAVHVFGESYFNSAMVGQATDTGTVTKAIRTASRSTAGADIPAPELLG